MGVRTPQPPPKGPAEGRALGEGLRGPYANRRSLRNRTGPPKPASTLHFATTHFAHPDQRKAKTHTLVDPNAYNPRTATTNATNTPAGEGGVGGALPLSRALQQVWVFRFFDPGPGASGGPRKVPLSVGLPGASGGLPEAPGA